MMTESEQRTAVIEEATSWIGTKFHYSACVKKKGLDSGGVACGPFLIACYKPYAKDAGLVLPSPDPFPKDWHFNTEKERFLDIVKQFCREVETPKSGDTVLFRLGNKTRPYSHGGIVVDWPNQVLHAWYKSSVQPVNVTQDANLYKAEVSFWSPWGFVYPTESNS